MTTKFQPVITPKEVSHLAQMAGAIWREYWPDLIGEAQTEYMVANFQSLEAIKRDMATENYEYWFILSDTPDARTNEPAGRERIVGYTGGHEEPETDRFFISKIYLFKNERGKGYASEVVRFYENLCKERNLKAMYLTVNKGNDMGIRAYKTKGFETIDAVETDIGSGFIMDDYIMEKCV